MSHLNSLRDKLESLGATEVQRQTFETNPSRSVAALGEAQKRGAQNPLAYALRLFNGTEFQPRHADQVVGTNRHANVNCRRCSGDRVVVYATRTDTYNGRSAAVDEYVPCPDCNAGCNTERMGVRCPDPTRVRERLAA